MTEQRGRDHQRCVFHLRRWVGRALRELSGQLPDVWHPLLAQIATLVGTVFG